MCDELDDHDHAGGDDIDRADYVYVLHDDGWHVIDYFDGDEHALDDDELADDDEQSASASDYIYDQSDDG